MNNIGLLIRIKSKPESSERVAQLLENAVNLVQNEKHTLTWYSFRIDKDTFGIFDTFNDENGKEVHLQGPLMQLLSNHTEELMIGPPEIEKIQILSAKEFITKD